MRVRGVLRRGLRRPVRGRRRLGLLDAVPRGGGSVLLLQGGGRRAALRRRAGRLHAVARHAVHAPGGGGRGRPRARSRRRRRPLQGLVRPRLAGAAVRQLRHYVDAALAERAAGTQGACVIHTATFRAWRRLVLPRARHAMHARREFDLTEFPFAVPS